MNPINFKEALPSKHQAALANGGKKLFAGNRWRQIGEIEPSAPHGHSP